MLLHADVHGTLIQIETDDRRFYEFAKINLFHYLDSNPGSDINVHSIFSKDRYEGILSDESKINQYHHYENEYGFKCFYQLERTTIHIYSYHYNLPSSLDKDYVSEDYQRCYRWVVSMPIMIIQRIDKKRTILHAASFVIGQRVYVLLGDGGIGKSTLTLNSIDRYQAKVISDNYLLASGTRIYSFPESFKVDSNSKYAIVPDRWFISKRLIYNKYHLLPSAEDIQFDSEVEQLTLCISPSSSYDNHTFQERINRVHHKLQEFPEHAFWNSLDIPPCYDINLVDLHKLRVNMIFKDHLCFDDFLSLSGF